MKLPVWQKINLKFKSIYRLHFFHRTCIKSAIWYGKKQLKEGTTKKVWIKLKQKMLKTFSGGFFPQVLFFSIFTTYSNLKKTFNTLGT
jgi:hypothetical protein